ncbi:syntaxin-binding protein 5 isoform X1 [Episyrphus balteatus]|uniref:syntaxin-binding protein 5 isoform X1 n=1 Tax=Episyrphus balteatus TaxID=286459 RepID=UPI002485D355|nr:syntaxin-binding protein 5 isoform X1 [Episyrphus balteatus]
MKKFTFKGVLDGFRSTVQAPSNKPEQEIQEQLRPDYFTAKKTFRHGFPHSPTALAFDPVQRLLVIGDKSGSLRILGRPGVDTHVRHEGDSACAVIGIEFLVNEGAIITATADDTLHLWNIRQKSPQVVQSLKFQRERITCIHLPVGSKWLYVGTEKGNIHVVHIETFALSGYIINWNKAIEVIRTTHPGAVIGLSDNPLDANKLLIAFESGLIVQWDLRNKCAEIRWQSPEPLRSIAWHHEGKHFVSSHTDGSICTWPLRPCPKPQIHSFPHAKTNKDGKPEACKPIHKVDLKTTRLGETYTIFSGGLSMEKGGKSPCITVMQGKSTTVLEMEHPVVDFITLCESPWSSDMQEPYAIAVLLQHDLVLIDLLTPGFPCFESPYPMDLHESPVTCCTYLADCPSDLVPAFYSVGRSTASRRTGFSDREWPVSGGEWSPASCSYSEIVITGHQDGTIKFWDAGAGSLQILYKLKTGKIFERPRARSIDNADDDPLGIQIITLCAESRRLCIAGSSGHVILFKFRKLESTSEILVLEIPIKYESFDDDAGGSPECEFVPRQAPKTADAVENDKKTDGMLRVRPGAQRKPPGFQAQLICLTPWTQGSHPGQITSLCLNSSYGLMAYGNEYGLAVVDTVQKVCLLSVASPDLYGAQDPYSRVPKSPKRGDNNKDEYTRSPSIDQLNDVSSSPQKVTQMPSSLPHETITATLVTQTAQSSPSVAREQSTSPSRPISPACEALETPQSSSTNNNSPTSEDQPALQSSESSQGRRKSIPWKAFNLKRQLSKVNMKISKTDPNTPSGSKSSSVFYCAPTEGTPLSPVEISPDSVSESTPTDTEQDKSDYMEQIEKDIVSSLNETENKEIAPEASLESTLDRLCGSNSDLSEPTSLSASQSNSTQNIAQSVPKINIHDRIVIVRTNKKERTMSQPQAVPISGSKRVDFSDEPAFTKSLVSTMEGAHVSRPVDLPLFDNDGDQQHPVAPPRYKKKDKRDQRLLSVPNIKYQVRDLRSRNGRGDPSPSFAGNLMRRFKQMLKERTQHKTSSVMDNMKHKLDSSFSRSRSSSMSSLENITSESITCLAFTDSYTKKSDPSVLLPTLWVGTSLGSVLTVSITLPETDTRKTQPVLVSILGGPIFRLKGSILSMSFLDCNGALIPYSFEPWRDENREKRERTPTKNTNRMSPTLSGATATSTTSGVGGSTSVSTSSSMTVAANPPNDSCSDRQFIVIASEKQARVVALPSQYCVYRHQITETDFVVKAEIVSMRESVCLVTYVSNGHLMAYSLPSLRPLLDVDFLPLIDLSFQTKCKQGIVDPMLSIWGQQLIVHEDTNQISKAFCFSNKGHGLYLASPTELQKFSLCSDFCQFTTEMMGELFVPHEMPEQPKESFFKGLFGVGNRSLDREELFGEQSGKANRSVAKHIPGPSLDQLGQRTSTAASEISRAHQLAMERGEKLNMLEERAERMANEAQNFTGTAHQLMLKYKDKKWYQL